MSTNNKATTSTDHEVLVERIRKENDIVSVVQGYGLKLKRTGKDYKGLCPFHSDTNPSLVVYPHTQDWYCFAEKKRGDVFSFVMLKEKCSSSEAVRILAKRAGISVPNDLRAIESTHSRRLQNQETLSHAANYYNGCLNKSKEVWQYLTQERGILPDTILNYRIGYAPRESAEPFIKHMRDTGFKKATLQQMGLLSKGDGDYFAGHIVFPYMTNGNVVYLSGRGYPDKSHKKPYSDKIPQNHLFFEDALYHNEAIIAEGEIDTYTLQQAGFNACGISGTSSFKEEWVSKFTHVERIYVALDGDEQGKKAALELASHFKNRARIVEFPERTTPDDERIKDWNELFIQTHKKNIESFQQQFKSLLASALPALEFKIKYILKKTNPSDMVEIVINEIIPDILQLNEIETDHYVDVIMKYSNGLLKKTSLRNEISKRKKEPCESDTNQFEILDDNCMLITPTLDFADGTAYVFIPAKIRRNAGDPKTSTVYQVVSSQRELFFATPQELRKRNCTLTLKPSFTDKRWLRKDINEFLKQEEDVNPAEVFELMKSVYEYFVDFGDNCMAEIIALYTIGTYLHRLFESYPYLFLTGEINSGKTKTLVVAQKLCFNAILASNITPATLFRVIAGSSCTYLLDEAEQLKSGKGNQDIICILNSGYRKGVTVYRINMNTYEPEPFEIYSPKMIANIKGMDLSLESRCIKFVMLKTNDKEKANRIVTEVGYDWARIRHFLYCMCLKHFAEIQQLYFQEIESSSEGPLSAREAELWFPLTAIAKFLENNGCEGLYERTVACAQEITKEAKLYNIDDWTEYLIYAVADIVLGTGQEKGITIPAIKSALDPYFREWDKRPNSHWIGRKLRNLGLVKNPKRTASGWIYDIPKENIKRVLENYGLDATHRKDME